MRASTTFHDEIFGDITVENDTLDDQVLIKRDGLPTYNFANVSGRPYDGYHTCC